ncbi:MAG: hypothetical protein JNL57_03245 [Bacteroidetes bacterium]|nr:hypothetical protein [Bacteroidota bacterium]
MSNDNLDPNKKSLSDFTNDAVSGSNVKGGDGGDIPVDPLSGATELPAEGWNGDGPGPFADPIIGNGGINANDPFNPNPTDPLGPSDDPHVGPDPLGRPPFRP